MTLSQSYNVVKIPHLLAAQLRVERLNTRVSQLEREKERLDYERQMAQMYLSAAVGPWSDAGSNPTGSELGDHACHHPAASHGGGSTVRCTSRGGSAKSVPARLPSTDSQPGHPPSSKASSRASSKKRQSIGQGKAGVFVRLSRGTGCSNSSKAASESLSVATSATAGELARACAPRKNLADITRPPPGSPHPLREFVMAIRGQRPAGKMPGKMPRGCRSTASSSGGSSTDSASNPVDVTVPIASIQAVGGAYLE